ncbi:MAG: lamin tail domain-containing protein [Verrucomicrobiales bacterium]
MFRLALLALVCPGFVTAGPVINEIHCEPPDKTKPVQFVEIHNPEPSAVNVSGWRLSDAVDFTFPNGTTLAAGGYVVVAENPPAFLTQFGRTALGPWSSNLRKSGETIALRDAAGTIVDEVDFRTGFPWPTAAAGVGPSIELIHPALDNSLGGSWRSSGYPIGTGADPVTYLAAGSGNWKWRPGNSEASMPIDAWRSLEFTEDQTWTTIGTPMGYGETFLSAPNTISGMRNVYRSIFLRRTFELSSVPPSAALRLKLDDGAVVWINGFELGRPRYGGAPGSAVTFNGLFATNAPEPVDFENIQIPNAAGVLRTGQNVIAVQLFNSTLDSSDLVFDAELREGIGGAGGTNPTPGLSNNSTAAAALAPPQIRQVEHSPLTPAAGEAVVVSARVSDPDGVGAVTLEYQPVDPGGYIRKTDAAFATTWTSLALNDTGVDGDSVAADGLFSTTVPASVQTHRRLVRYRITVADSGGRSVRVPYSDDECPNFAWFCYNGVPAWSGAIEPGVAGTRGTVKNFPAGLMNSLPVYHLVANGTDVTNSQWNGGSDTVRMWGSLVYEGKVYDHIQFHNRGEASTYQCGKNKWRFHFNRTRQFEPRDNLGRRYQETWDDFSLNACSSPWIVANRGMAGLDEAVSFRHYELAGLPSPKTHHLSLRVIDAAGETGATQYDGDVWGLYLAVESIDGSFLDERGLPDGNTYKIEGGGDKKNQGATHPLNTSDWDSFRGGSTAGATEAWWRANLNLHAYFSFHAVNRITGNVDLREGWNHCYYHHPDNRWIPIPWDLDMMFIAETHWSGTIDQRNCLNVPAINIEFKNRCRELLDLLCEDSADNGGQVGQVIDEYAQIVNPRGVPLTWADVDECMWSRHPRTTGGHTNNFYRTPYSQGQIGGTWNRTLPTADHEGFVAFLKGYTTDTDPNTFSIGDGDQRGYGFNYLELEASDTNVPARPLASYIGGPGFPVNDLRFQSSNFSGAAGVNFTAMEWRLAEIAAPGLAGWNAGDSRKYEIESTWQSGELTAFAAEVQVPVSAVRPDRVHRVRVRHKGSNGRWSRWSPAVSFTAGTPDLSVYTNSLVISEVMYHPAGPTSAEQALGFNEDDFEFVELRNVAATAVDLTDVRFTKGINFDFPPATVIAPGGYLLVVRNQAVFESRYGTGLPIAGASPDDRLSDNGEEIKLSYGAGAAIRSFVYVDAAPWPEAADGDGPSMVLTDPVARPDHSVPENWRSSYLPGGSPGGPDVLTWAAWIAAYPGTSDPDADSDGDGQPNRAEYLSGTNPLDAASAAAPGGEIRILDVNGQSAPYLTLNFTRLAAVADATAVAEFSSDLTSWSPGAVLVSSTASPDGRITETWRSPQPLANQSRLFGRVRVE